MGFFTRPDAPSAAASDLLPLSAETVRAVLDSWEAQYGVDDEGDLGGYWNGHLFYFLREGEASDVLLVRGRWTREIGAEHRAEAIEALNEWNTQRLWPKAYLREEQHDGAPRLSLYGELPVPLPHGCTPQQLDTFLSCALGTTLQLFEELDTRFPDAASAAGAAHAESAAGTGADDPATVRVQDLPG